MWSLCDARLRMRGSRLIRTLDSLGASSCGSQPAHIVQRVFAFQNRYNLAVDPFGWRYTRAYVTRLNKDGSLRTGS